MTLRWDRILDRVWLALFGAAAIAITLRLGAQLGARPWSLDAAPVAYAAAPAGLSRSAGCRGDR